MVTRGPAAAPVASTAPRSATRTIGPCMTNPLRMTGGEQRDVFPTLFTGRYSRNTRAARMRRAATHGSVDGLRAPEPCSGGAPGHPRPDAHGVRRVRAAERRG